MNKNPLKLIFVIGIASGIFLSASQGVEEAKTEKTKSKKKLSLLELAEKTDGNITFSLMDEEELLLHLTAEGGATLKSLSPEGKEMALRIASRSCNGTNECKGENACRTDKNKCLGQGSCKGETKCAISDKNVAVRMAAKKMAEKREGALNSPN